MDIRKTLRDTRVEIDTDRLRHNYRELKRYLSPGTEIAAVVKANGYGHGALEAGRVFYEEGARYLAVANFSEGMELKAGDERLPVMVMGYTQDNQLECAVEAGLVLTVFDYEQAEMIDKHSQVLGVKAEIHLKVNTGFNRLGLSAGEVGADEIMRISKLRNIRVEGIFTHLALTGRDEDKAQYELFRSFISELEKRGVDIPVKHICDSLGAVRYPEYQLDMIRAGAILYGYYNGRTSIDLRPAMEFKSRISTINTVKGGDGVSYDYLYKAEGRSRIAVVPVGYADGYPRTLWKRGRALAGGVKVPIAGIICMDQLMIDVTEAGEVKPGDDVTLWGEGIGLEEVSLLAGTNKNDLIASVSRRVPRVYLQGGEVVRIKDYLMGEWEA